MKRFLFITTLLMTPLSAFADIIPVDNSKIVSATVYTDRATVTRQAVVTVPAGSHDVTFTGLPVYMFPDSLRAEGEALAAVK